MTEEHVEIESGLVIPKWFLTLGGVFGTMIIAWGAWVTMTLGKVSYKIDDMADDFDVGKNATMQVHINDLMRRVDKLESAK